MPKQYKIPVVWTMAGYVTVEANSLDEAFDAALHEKLPLDGDYVSDSFQIDYDNAPSDESES